MQIVPKLFINNRFLPVSLGVMALVCITGAWIESRVMRLNDLGEKAIFKSLISLSFKSQNALVEPCLKQLTFRHTAFLSQAEVDQILEKCEARVDAAIQRIPNYAEGYLVRAMIAQLRSDPGAAGANLALSRQAAPRIGWLALQRLSLWAELPAEFARPEEIVADFALCLSAFALQKPLAAEFFSWPASMREAAVEALAVADPDLQKNFLSLLETQA